MLFIVYQSVATIDWDANKETNNTHDSALDEDDDNEIAIILFIIIMCEYI